MRAVLARRALPMDENPLALENERLRDQLRKDADALKELRLDFDKFRREREELHRELGECRREREELDRELDELRRERGYERQQAEARINECESVPRQLRNG
jgi:chromosome segregation ATPase